MSSVIGRLKERKLVQWGLAYLAGAWVVMQFVDVLGGRWGWPATLQQATDVLLLVGLPVVLVLAWYHAEQERERVSGTELLILALLLSLGGGVFAILRPTAPDQTVSDPPAIVRFAFDAPAPGRLQDLSLSRDGTRIAFTAAGPAGPSQLWIRFLELEEAVAIDGTEGAAFPFWAPDGGSVAFFQQERLMRLDLATLATERITDAPNGRGGAWNAAGTIVFASSGAGPLSAISAEGGELTAVTEVNEEAGESGHRFPQFLPDGRHFTFFIRGLRSIGVGSLDDEDHQVLGEAWSEGLPVADHLLFLRGNSLVMQRFDEGQRQLLGEALPVVSPVPFQNPLGNAVATVSSNGVLAYRLGERQSSRLVWVDRRGSRLESLGEPGEHGRPRLSPDGSQVLFHRFETVEFFVWTLDLSQGRYERITRGDFPNWSHDNRTIVFRRGSDEDGLYHRELGAAADSESLLVGSVFSSLGADVSDDGTFMAYSSFDAGTGDDIWTFNTGDLQRQLAVSGPGNQTQPRISPTGEWIAYETDQTGSAEVYAFSRPDRRFEKVSNAGGSEPRWSADGRELMYRDPAGTVMVVALGPAGFSAPEPLFQIGSGSLVSAADGERILIRAPQGEDPSDKIHVALNWLNERR